MAWVERFTCDVCGKLMGESESWWVAANECAPPRGQDPAQPVLKLMPPPVLKLMPWDNLMGHSAESHHLCGAVCVHTFLDRWMAEARSGLENCVDGS